MSEYGSRDPRRFLDGWLDRLLWRLGIARRGRFTRLAAAYDDVFGWWSKLAREQMAKEEAELAKQEVVEVQEGDVLAAYVVEKLDPETFTKLGRGDTPEPNEKK